MLVCVGRPLWSKPLLTLPTRLLKWGCFPHACSVFPLVKAVSALIAWFVVVPSVQTTEVTAPRAHPVSLWKMKPNFSLYKTCHFVSGHAGVVVLRAGTCHQALPCAASSRFSRGCSRPAVDGARLALIWPIQLVGRLCDEPCVRIGLNLVLPRSS